MGACGGVWGRMGAYGGVWGRACACLTICPHIALDTRVLAWDYLSVTSGGIREIDLCATHPLQQVDSASESINFRYPVSQYSQLQCKYSSCINCTVPLEVCENNTV